MKLNVEVLDGVLVIEDQTDTMKIVIEAQTGDILYLEHTETNIDKLYSFINKARGRYRKFMQSKAADEFKI